jgi:hypothetical protein
VNPKVLFCCAETASQVSFSRASESNFLARTKILCVNPKVPEEVVEIGLVGGSNLHKPIPSAKKPG